MTSDHDKMLQDINYFIAELENKEKVIRDQSNAFISI